MSENQTRPSQSVSKPAWPARSNAFVSIQDEGSASASASASGSALHSAYSTDSVLTGLQQNPLSVMSSPGDHMPGSFFSSSDTPFPDYSGSFDSYSFQHIQSDSQYSFSSPASSLPPRFVDSSSVAIDGVPSHQTATGPWSHLAATEGMTSLLPGTLNPTEPGLASQHLRTPVHNRAYSSASARKSLGDSGYETRSRKSQHEVDSVMEERTEMDERDTMTPIPYLLPDSYTLSNSSTVGQPATQRPQQRSRELECVECDFVGKTRSDLKKHSARHKREHKCPFQNCQRHTQGFATVNDLDRHLKAVHNINKRNSRSYKCFADGCSKAEKEWPRLDNFKQHLKKMHKDKKMEELLELSNKWYEKTLQQTQADETASLATSVPSRSSHPLISIPDNDYAAPTPPFDSNATETLQMSRPLGHNDPLINHDLTHAMSQQNQDRSTSTATHALSLQQQQSLSTLDTNNLSSTTAYVQQRAWSQADFSRYQDLSHLHSDFTNQRVNCHFLSRPARKSSDATNAAMRTNSVLGYFQPGRSKRPNTIAVPDLDPDRMTDFVSPQELPHVPPDLGDSQEDFLSYVGCSTNSATADNSSVPLPHQGFQASMMHAENTSKSGLQKAMEDEISSFLELHRSNGGNEFRSDEEILNQFRLSLHCNDGVTSYAASSVGPASRITDAELPGGFRLSPTKPAQVSCQYPGCTKVMQRQSELKKHMKRHYKPYGCVFDGCTKTFGSKDDWKRHEQTQHEQQECWFCDKCFRVFFHDFSSYIGHMREVHSVSRPEEYATQRRITRNYQGGFWCGFCKTIITHSMTDVEALTLRFDHIADHFMKDHKSSKDWVELTGHGKTKGALCEKGKPDEGIAEEEDGALEASQAPSEAAQSSASQQSGFSSAHQPLSAQSFSPSSTKQESSRMDYIRDSTIMPQTPDMSTTAQSQGQGQGQGQNSNSNSGSHRGDHKRYATVIICCQCKMSNAYRLSTRCMDPACHQEFCPRCTLKNPKDAR
ncbi:hypothetical protein AYL99_02730 [Fonsecaea erecta]|uniref:C2H2-type domain-containing protein n=1 Tax=Fonsecaea erecta TaxID=1367422 RepID=A0A178ZW72_9EURO|nr:hypothetical protein AYL99_02730 [Fonsecaea erecta]OAP63503.1 hypothetical protein AYL99_02730 [Fonsecaea erecta]